MVQGDVGGSQKDGGSAQLCDVDGDSTACTPGLGCIRVCIQLLYGGYN